MGWSVGCNNSGRPIGYAIEATCDHPGCVKHIHRGVSFACGGHHDAGEFFCDQYFCEEHREVVETPQGDTIGICQACAKFNNVDEEGILHPEE